MPENACQKARTYQMLIALKEAIMRQNANQWIKSVLCGLLVMALVTPAAAQQQSSSLRNRLRKIQQQNNNPKTEVQVINRPDRSSRQADDLLITPAGEMINTKDRLQKKRANTLRSRLHGLQSTPAEIVKPAEVAKPKTPVKANAPRIINPYYQNMKQVEIGSSKRQTVNQNTVQQPLKHSETSHSNQTRSLKSRLKALKQRVPVVVIENQPTTTQTDDIQPELKPIESVAPIVTTAEEPQKAFEQTLQKHQRGSSKRNPLSHQADRLTGNALLNSKGPALSVKTEGPRKMTIGRSSTYTIRVANSTVTLAEDVMVNINLPAWAQVSKVKPTYGRARTTEKNGRKVVQWQLSKMPGLGEEQLQLKIVPKSNKPFDLSVQWAYTPQVKRTQIEVQEPKLAVDLSGPQEILYGQTKVFRIKVSNPGTGDAENVVVRFLPDATGKKYVNPTKIDRLSAGSQKVVEVELTAKRAGPLNLGTVVSADGGLHAKAKWNAVVRRAKLHVDLVGERMKFSQSVATFQARIVNLGDAPAEQVVATANLPSGAKLVKCSDGGKLSPTGKQIVWQVGSLRAGASKIFRVDCQLNEPGNNRLEFTAGAETGLSAASEFITKIEAIADLKLTVNDPRGPVAVGETAVYEIHIENRGTKSAKNVQVIGFFSEGIEAFAASGAPTIHIKPGDVEFSKIEKIAPGEKLTLKIMTKATVKGTHVFRAEVHCKKPNTKLATEETTRFYGRSISSLKPMKDLKQQ